MNKKKPKSMSPFVAHAEQNFKWKIYIVFLSLSAIYHTLSVSLCACRSIFVHKSGQTGPKCLLVRVNQLHL